MPDRKTRVLVVDDDEDIRFGVRLTLEAQGYEVDEASDGEECMFLLGHSTFDIAIIDMIMPNKNGIDTIKKLKEKLPNLAIIAMSGGSAVGGEITYLEFAKRAGANATLKKPFKADDLIVALNGLGNI